MGEANRRETMVISIVTGTPVHKRPKVFSIKSKSSSTCFTLLQNKHCLLFACLAGKQLSLIQPLLQQAKGLFNSYGHKPVNNHAGQIDFNAISAKVLSNNQIALANHINQTNGIGQSPLLQQVDN